MHPAQPSIARTVRCPTCGGAAPLTHLAPAIPCPFCRHTITVPPEMLRELSAYGTQVETARSQAESDAHQAEQWRKWTSHGASASRQTLMGIGLVMGPPIVLGVVGGALASARVIPAQAVSAITMFSAMGGIAVYAFWYSAGLRQRRAQAAAQGPSVSCPHCGAVNTFTPGQALERCRFCGAGLVASRTIMRDVVADAERAALQAKLDRHRAERSGMAYYSGLSGTRYLPILIPGIYIGMLGLGAVGMTFSMLFGTAPFDSGVLFLWSLFLVSAGILYMYFRYRSDRRQAWRDATEAVTRPLGGCALDGVPAVVSWLNTYWVGPIELGSLAAGPYFQGAAGVAEGYPFLIWADPVASSNQTEPRVQILVAAWLPGGHAPRGETPAAAAIRASLAQVGLGCVMNEAGVLVAAEPHLCKSLHRSPEAPPLLHAVWRAVHLAQALGARPAEPLPA